jgi:hypothetical protein
MISKKEAKHLTEAAAGATGKRFCSHCQQHKQSIGGFWRLMNNGKNRRWLCSACVVSRHEKL